MSDPENMFNRVGDTVNKAKKISKKLGKKAVTEAPKISHDLKKEATKVLGDAVTTARDLINSPENRLDLLKKLYELKTAGIISEREFQTKKKQILDKIK